MIEMMDMLFGKMQSSARRFSAAISSRLPYDALLVKRQAQCFVCLGWRDVMMRLPVMLPRELWRRGHENKVSMIDAIYAA